MFPMILDIKWNTDVGAGMQQNMPIEQVSLKRRSSTRKQYYGLTIALSIYRSATHKYKQNITLNVITTQVHVALRLKIKHHRFESHMLISFSNLFLK